MRSRSKIQNIQCTIKNSQLLDGISPISEISKENNNLFSKKKEILEFVQGIQTSSSDNCFDSKLKITEKSTLRKKNIIESRRASTTTRASDNYEKQYFYNAGDEDNLTFTSTSNIDQLDNQGPENGPEELDKDLNISSQQDKIEQGDNKSYKDPDCNGIYVDDKLLIMRYKQLFSKDDAERVQATAVGVKCSIIMQRTKINLPELLELLNKIDITLLNNALNLKLEKNSIKWVAQENQNTNNNGKSRFSLVIAGNQCTVTQSEIVKTTDSQSQVTEGKAVDRDAVKRETGHNNAQNSKIEGPPRLFPSSMFNNCSKNSQNLSTREIPTPAVQPGAKSYWRENYDIILASLILITCIGILYQLCADKPLIPGQG